MDLILPTLVFFGGCMLAMAVGILLTGKKLRGSCGQDSQSEDLSCGVCAKQEHDVCASSDDNGELVRLATLGAPNRKKS